MNLKINKHNENYRKINIINILNIKLELISYNIKYNLCTKS